MPSLLDRRVSQQAWREEAGQRNGTSLTGAGQAPDAGSWEPAVVKLVEFQHLGDNWDGLGARAPSRELLASAVGLAYLLNDSEVGPPTRVAPGPDGSVLLEWQFPDGTYAEIEIDRPLHAEVMMVEPGRPAKHWTLPTE